MMKRHGNHPRPRLGLSCCVHKFVSTDWTVDSGQWTWTQLGALTQLPNAWLFSFLPSVVVVVVVVVVLGSPSSLRRTQLVLLVMFAALAASSAWQQARGRAARVGGERGENNCVAMQQHRHGATTSKREIATCFANVGFSNTCVRCGVDGDDTIARAFLRVG